MIQFLTVVWCRYLKQWRKLHKGTNQDKLEADAKALGYTEIKCLVTVGDDDESI